MVLLVQILETVAAKTGTEISTVEFGYSHPLVFYFLIFFVFVVACLFKHSDFSAFLICSFNSTFIQRLPGQFYVFNLFPRRIIMSQTWDCVRHFIERNVTKMKRIRECLESSREVRSAAQMLISNRRRGVQGKGC